MKKSEKSADAAHSSTINCPLSTVHYHLVFAQNKACSIIVMQNKGGSNQEVQNKRGSIAKNSQKLGSVTIII